jgi:integrase
MLTSLPRASDPVSDAGGITLVLRQAPRAPGRGWISTGVRAAELIGLRRRDVDPGQQLISVMRNCCRSMVLDA